MAESQGDGIDLVEHYKALTDELEEKIKILMATMKEKDLQMVSLKEQYEEVLQNLQVREDRIVDLEFELLSSSQTKGSAKKCLFSEQANIEAEKSISFYIKQVEEKDLDIERLNSEIQKLNSEVNKRTGDLQGLINKELWEKNRYIEKLQNRHTAAIETKDKEIAELRSDLSCKDMQLNVLKDNISELGIEISMETLSQNTDIENVKKLEAQLKAAIEERKYFENKIQQLEEQYASYASEDEKVMFIEKLREDISNLQKEYEHSEQLRRETNEICSVLSSRLEELAVFLDSLLKQKSVLGFLGSKENKMLRQIIDQSLDLSRTFNMSMLPSNDQSLMQLSNLTSILNTSEVETQQVADESKQGEDDNTSLSIIPENITLTYRSHLYSSTVSNRTEDITEAINPHIIKALRNQVQNLKYELQLRDVELNKLNEAIYQQKNESNLPDDDRDNQCISLGVGDNIITEKRPNSASKPSSPNKSGLNTSSTLKYQNENQSESEAWSEPDRSVSKARIGLDTPNSSRPSSGKRSKLTCKVSSESTEDDCVRGLSRTPSKKSLIENRQTIIELHKQLCDLEEKLLEKDTKLTKLEASNTETNNLLKDEMLNHNKIRSELENLEVQFKDTQEQLASAERLKADAENKLQHLENVVEGLRSEKEKLEMHLEGQTKDMYEQLNILESEKNQVMIEAKETEKDLENVRAELKHAENKLVEMQEVMNNIEGQLREEYTGHVISKLKDAEEEFVKQLRITEEKAQTEMRMSQEKIKQMEQEYAQDFIRKCEVDSIILEMEKSIQENDVLKSTIYEREQTIDKLKSKEKEHKNKLAEYQERIHVLSKDLDNTTLQYSQAVLENTKLANEKVMLEQELSKFSQKESEMKQQISEIQTELQNVKQNYQKQVSLLQDQKIKLEIKISELESANAELHNRLISLRTNTTGDQIYSSSLPSTSGLYDIGNRDIPVNQLMNRKRQFTEYVSEAQMVGNSRDVGLQFGQPLPLNQNNPAVDMERHEANSSPDLGIESDHGRFSSLEAQLNIPRPLLQTLELTESMNNLLDAENNQIQSVDCGTEHCCKKTLEMAHENSDLKKKLMRTRRALEETVTQLTLANKRKKQVEKTICKQIHMTSQVLRKAKANLDSGSETDVYKK